MIKLWLPVIGFFKCTSIRWEIFNFDFFFFFFSISFGTQIWIDKILFIFSKIHFGIPNLLTNAIFMKVMTLINSLWPNDAIWWHRSGSSLVLVMWLTTPSYYLNLITCINSSLVRYYGIHRCAISKYTPKLLFCVMNLKIITFRSLPHFQLANELIWW